MESIELSRPVLTQGRTDMLEKWLTEVSVGNLSRIVLQVLSGRISRIEILEFLQIRGTVSLKNRVEYEGVMAHQKHASAFQILGRIAKIAVSFRLL